MFNLKLEPQIFVNKFNGRNRPCIIIQFLSLFGSN